MWRLAERPSPVVMPAGRSAEVRTALRLSEEQLADEVRLEDVAAEVGLVPRSLARRFEAEVGMTRRATLRRMRVLRAVERLAADDTPVTTIAHEVGYGSLSAFNAAMRSAGMDQLATPRPRFEGRSESRDRDQGCVHPPHTTRLGLSRLDVQGVAG